jgi:hypothetical protein
LKVAGILETKLVETQSAEQKVSRIPATLKNPAKNFLDKSVFKTQKIDLSSRVGLAETVKSTHWKITHKMIHQFSSPVQFKSNFPPEPTENQCFSQKT